MHRPEVDVVVPHHAAECDVSRAKNEQAKQRAMGHCRCPKDLYVRRTRLRISANTRSWERAREEAHAYADQHDPKLIAQRTEKEKKPEPVLLSDAIEKFIEARRLVNSSEKTIANLKPDCYQFLEYVNQRNRTLP